jgi:exodeoxyribonuclease V alpha subunit
MSDVSLADQLALWITRHGGDEVVAAWTRRLSLERARGHSCVLLEDHAGSEGLPGLDESLAALEASTLVGNGGAPTPLVVSGRLLWLYRDHVAEQRIALSIRERDMLSFDLHGRDRISGLFAQLYPDACASGAPLAAATALFGGLTILTGGPGTGKTTAVVRMLALLLANDPGLEIALAAPTGKAAARLQESIHGQLAGLPVGDELRERLRLDVRTVHGLLGIRPGSARIRHDADHPNPADVVVVDEASMVDLQIMDRLLAAVKPDARLILVGDRDQLASVDAGAVLADLVLARGTTDDVRSRGFAHRARVLGLEVKVEDSERPLGDALVELRRNYRFETRPGIASVATALREGDADRVLEILANDTTPDARRVDLDRGNLIGALDPLLDELPDPGVRDPALWLDLLEHRFRLLGATHAGPHGVTALNELVESRLRARGWGTDETWYPGRAILIERNHDGERRGAHCARGRTAPRSPHRLGHDAAQEPGLGVRPRPDHVAARRAPAALARASLYRDHPGEGAGDGLRRRGYDPRSRPRRAAAPYRTRCSAARAVNEATACHVDASCHFSAAPSGGSVGTCLGSTRPRSSGSSAIATTST